LKKRFYGAITRSILTILLVMSIFLIVAGVISVGRFFAILAMIFDILRRVFEELSGMFP